MSTQTPSITLYLSPGACSLAPHILLHEALAPSPFSTVHLSVRGGFDDAYAKLNPKKRVPILVLASGGPEQETITEVPAILTAIAQMAPEKHLLGRTNMEVVRSYEWFNYLSGTLHGQGFGGMWRPTRFSDERTANAGMRRKGKLTVEECFEYLEGKLTGSFAVGEEFSAVDAYLYVFWRWGCEIGVDMKGRFPRYEALMRKVVSREAVKRALESEEVESFIGGVSQGEKVRI